MKKATTKKRGARKARGRLRAKNPRYFVVGIDHAGREHDLAVRVALNKTQTLQWAKQHYPGFKKYEVTLSDKADFIGQSGMIKARRPKRARNKTIIKAKTIQQWRTIRSSNPSVKSPRKKLTGRPLLKRRRNSATTEKLGAIRQEFTGRSAGKVASMFVSDKSPSSLTKLAKFLELKLTDGRIIKPATGTTWICSDTKKKIHFATTGNRLYDGPKGNIAKVATIAYREWKPSVGSNKTEDYEHQFGEEGGTLPMLVSDGKGGLYLRGGSYKITDKGIVD